jgi:tRNA(fMet)-specific endonuclease VapC
MTTYLLDTNHASALWRNDTVLVARIAALTDAELALRLPSIGELWFMVHNSSRIAANEISLRTFLSRFRQFAFDAVAAEQFGQIKAHLRKVGLPIPAVDVQIAAIARAHGLTVLTADAHFASVPNIQHENWL